MNAEIEFTNPLYWNRDTAVTATSAILFLGGSTCLFYKLKKKFGEVKILPKTQACLRSSALWATASWGLGMIPVVLIKNFVGWHNVRNFYNDMLFGNIFGSALSLLTPLVLTGATVALPSDKNPTLRKQLWAITCLMSGFIATPLFTEARDALTIAGGFASGITIPLTVAAAISNNFLNFNILGWLGIVAGTSIMRKYVLPYILEERYKFAGIPLLAKNILDRELNIGCSLSLLAGLIALLSANGFVNFVQECYTHVSDPSQLRKIATTQSSERPKWMIFDGRDPISNGILLSGYAGFALVHVLSKIVNCSMNLFGIGSKSKKLENFGPSSMKEKEHVSNFPNLLRIW